MSVPGPSRGRALAALFALALATVAVPAAPAGAQAELGCAPDIGIDARIAEAPTVFTGTVKALGNKGRTATVDVIRVWKGGTLPKRVQVTGTIATQAKVVTALDRLYAEGTTYLFVPPAGTNPRFIENRCSATRQLTPELAAKEPGGGSAPVGEGVPLPQAGLGKLVPLMIVIPALLVLAGLLLAARRKARRIPSAAAPGT
jgi:hypothetical protein